MKTETITIGGIVKLVSGSNAGKHARITKVKGKKITVEFADAPVVTPATAGVEPTSKPPVDNTMTKTGKRRGRKRIEIPREAFLKASQEGRRTTKGVRRALARRGIRVSAYIVRRMLKETRRRGRKRIAIPHDVLMKAHDDGGRTIKGAREELAKQGITVCMVTLSRLLRRIGRAGWNKVDVSTRALIKGYKESGESIRGTQKALAKRGIKVGIGTIERSFGRSGKKCGPKRIEVPPEILLKAYKEGGGTVNGTLRVLTGQGMKISNSTVFKKLNELRMSSDEMLKILSRKD
jgi:hypothetical protein